MILGDSDFLVDALNISVAGDGYFLKRGEIIALDRDCNSLDS
jgi:hypothetical protein